jgi:mRNA-degrading endonuclease YafQ of YafQ-DinJ toxin-antitoxin module
VIEVAFASSFQRAYRKRIQGTGAREDRFWERLGWFVNNPFDPRLRTHKLSGKLKDSWAFSLDQDIRVLFNFEDGRKRAVLFDTGTHDEVY